MPTSFSANVWRPASIPQISAIMGPCAGGAVYSPAMTDFIFMVEQTSYMFITGPDVIKAVTHEEVTKEELGGAMTHNGTQRRGPFCGARRRGLPESRSASCCLSCRQNNMEDPPRSRTPTIRADRDDAARTIVPADANKPYDIKDIIRCVVDDGDFFEVHEHYRQEHRGRLRAAWTGCRSASWPTSPASWPAASTSMHRVKGARFVRFCDAFNIPLMIFEDVPGFLPGIDQEHGGIIRHGAKLLYAFCEATVPKITVITRKAYGGAYCVMTSKHIRGDINLAYPTAEIAVMGPEGAVNIIFRDEIEKAADPDGRTAAAGRRVPGEVRQSLRARPSSATSTK